MKKAKEERKKLCDEGEGTKNVRKKEGKKRNEK